MMYKSSVFLFLVVSFSLGAQMNDTEALEIATFGGGCFWCIEAVFEQVEGVLFVASGYSGGKEENPTYEQVSRRATGHAEVVQLHYDPKRVSYADLLEWFWRVHDPTTKDRQGADVGPQYRSIILWHNKEQKRIAQQSIKEYQQYYSKPIVTQVVPFTVFYRAEGYHQNYYARNGSAGYCRLVIAPKLRKLKLSY